MNSYRQGEWLGSPNFTPQRQGVGITHVVLHTMVGSVADANARFQQASEQASANYGVAYDGRLVQWVDECDAAWHCGEWDMNMASIGIEHEDMGNYDAPRPDALYAASAALLRGVCQRYGIPIDREHILDHRSVIATGCPDALDTDRIIREASAPPSPQPTVPPADEETIMQLTHSNGTHHWAYIHPTDRKVMHGVWSGAEPEMMPVSDGTTNAIRAFFEDPATHRLVLVVDGDDGAEYYEGTMSVTTDLGADSVVAWVKR